MKQYNLVVCGGTFDHFHNGHKQLLRFALSQSKKLIIGITSDEYVKNAKRKTQNAKLVELYKERKESVEKFLAGENAQKKTEIISIDDIYGPTLEKDLPIDAIAVSDSTKDGAMRINNERQQLRLLPLVILTEPLLPAQDGQPISSSRIRNGEITRDGIFFIRPEWLKKTLMLPELLRQELKQPIDALFKNGEGLKLADLDPDRVITIGDVVTKMCNDMLFGQKISVIDFYVERQKQFTHIKELGFSGDEEIIQAENPAGYVTSSLFRAAIAVFNKTQNQKRVIVQVDGEEDLAVLPFLLSCPLGWTILYGQPKEGVVKVNVSEENKARAYSILNRFVEG